MTAFNPMQELDWFLLCRAGGYVLTTAGRSVSTHTLVQGVVGGVVCAVGNKQRKWSLIIIPEGAA